MATLKIADRHVLGPPAALAATAYLAFYLLFTGAIQYTATTPIGIKGIPNTHMDTSMDLAFGGHRVDNTAAVMD